MPFLETNSHLTTKPYNFDIKCQSNSESYDRHRFFWDQVQEGYNILLSVGGFFFNEREYSGADILVPLVMQSHNWIDFGYFSIFFCKFFLKGTYKKRITTCKIILTPPTKEPQICLDLAPTSAFNLELCHMEGYIQHVTCEK